jgi:membrane-associated phospholipid phosphatase
MLENIIHFDWRLFHYMNGVWHTSFLDAVLPMIRNPFTWVPLYFFLLLFMTINYKWRGAGWCLFFFLTFSITDRVSAGLIKNWVQRLRPCHDPIISHIDRLLIPCGGLYSFPSSHASNHFGLAAFMFFTLSQYFGKWIYIVFFWAFIISYAQVYVGVHFPIDIFAGTILGMMAGFFTAKMYNRFIGLEKLT